MVVVKLQRHFIHNSVATTTLAASSRAHCKALLMTGSRLH